MLTTAPPTDQRAGVRPISFLLSTAGVLGTPVTLKIRPTDLTRNEPSRVAVHQTLGRGVQGWADNFGEGLPSVVIAGHTGWRAGGASGLDGAQAFDQLNQLIVHDYHAAKQLAIDTGLDPSMVKLLFIDMLDDFCWSVAPGPFQLRRSKSQPLLYQYNISLQAVSTFVDNPLMVVPFLGNIPAGLGALGTVISKLQSIAATIKGWVSSAVSFVDKALAPIAAIIKTFVDVSTAIMSIVVDTVGAIKNGISRVANNLIGLASGIAQVGINIFRTISAIASLPAYLKSAISSVGSAFNEAFCILKNSLRPRKVYDDYDGLYGASNCSSTTGGRSASSYLNTSALNLMQVDASPVSLNSSALSSISALNRSDPVLAQIPLADLSRHVDNINNGVVISTASTAVYTP